MTEIYLSIVSGFEDHQSNIVAEFPTDIASNVWFQYINSTQSEYVYENQSEYVHASSAKYKLTKT